MTRVFSLFLLAALAAGCGSSGTRSTTATTTASGPKPAILIERPGPHSSVPATFTVAGTASVFEATFVVELRRDGALLQRTTATATEGAPGRGTFSVRLHAPSPGAATVVAYEASAADGSPLHVQRVPVTVTP